MTTAERNSTIALHHDSGYVHLWECLKCIPDDDRTCGWAAQCCQNLQMYILTEISYEWMETIVLRTSSKMCLHITPTMDHNSCWKVMSLRTWRSCVVCLICSTIREIHTYWKDRELWLNPGIPLHSGKQNNIMASLHKLMKFNGQHSVSTIMADILLQNVGLQTYCDMMAQQNLWKLKRQA
jgi:hypothetical protein